MMAIENIMRTLEVKIAVLQMITSAFTVLSCTHVVHRAGVEPGINASVMIGPTYNTYSPSSANHDSERYIRDTQLSVGYAWRIKQTHRLLVQWNANSMTSRDSDRDTWSSSGNNIYSTGLDIYWQGSSEPTNSGVGLVLGLDPKLYLMWGRDYGNPGAKFRTGLDFGLGFGFNVSIIPQLMYTVRYKSLQSSILIEYRMFANSINLCDEGCDNEYLRSRLMFAVVFAIDQPKSK